jgi:hypothetical protein
MRSRSKKQKGSACGNVRGTVNHMSNLEKTDRDDAMRSSWKEFSERIFHLDRNPSQPRDGDSPRVFFGDSEIYLMASIEKPLPVGCVWDRRKVGMRFDASRSRIVVAIETWFSDIPQQVKLKIMHLMLDENGKTLQHCGDSLTPSAWAEVIWLRYSQKIPQ